MRSVLDSRRKVLAAVLYVVGVVAVLFTAYLEHAYPHPDYRLILFWVVGMILVAIAAMLWPVTAPTEPEERGNDAREEEAG